MPQDVVDLENLPISAEEVHAELDTLLRSPAFDRSERLQKFLRYICELTLNGEGSRINEYLIGSEVFRKGANYNPNEDSIVRRQAHTLRQKLQDYYSGEGRDRPVRIELPVGRYVPVFRRREQPASPAAASSNVIPQSVNSVESATFTPSSRRSTVDRRLILACGAGVLFGLGLAAGALWKSNASTWAARPPIEDAAKEIWGPWLSDSREAVICFSNPPTAVVKRLDQPPGPNVTPPRFPMHPSEEAILRDALRFASGGRIYFTPAINMAKMGEAISGVFLGQFLGAAGKSVNVTQSRFLNWEDVRRQNLIFLGNNESNQWIDPLLKKYPLRIGSTAGNEPRSIVNSQPVEGEQPVYRIDYSGGENEAVEEYALVSMLAGFEGEHHLLLINGLNTQATQMATEYLTKKAALEELLTRLRAIAPQHTGPWRFQAVLKTEVYDKVPTRAALVTVRVLK